MKQVRQCYGSRPSVALIAADAILEEAFCLVWDASSKATSLPAVYVCTVYILYYLLQIRTLFKKHVDSSSFLKSLKASA